MDGIEATRGSRRGATRRASLVLATFDRDEYV